MPDRADARVFSLAPVPVVRPGLPRRSRSSPSAATSTTATTASSRSSATTPTCSWPIRRSASCFVLAMSSIAVYGVMLAGWSSGSKYPLLGSVRASAQMVSYEAALGLSVVAVVLVTGTLSHPRHRRLTRPATAPVRPNWNVIAHRRRAVRHLRHRRHRRAEPAAVRPRRGRAGAGRRLQHRVLARSASPCSSWPSS